MTKINLPRDDHQIAAMVFQAIDNGEAITVFVGTIPVLDLWPRQLDLGAALTHGDSLAAAIEEMEFIRQGLQDPGR